MSFVDNLDRKISSTPKVTSLVGLFLAMVGPLARVNVQGTTVDIRCDGWNPPQPGMPVRVETVAGVMRVVGPSQTLPARATVVESIESGVKALVTADGQEWTLPVMAPYVPIPDDIVVLNWQSGHVLGEEAATPDPVEPPPVIPPSVQPIDGLWYQAADSGKWDTSWSNWWGGSEVWASNNNDGAWFYHGRHSALAGANVTKLEIFLPMISTVGSCSIGMHPHQTRPGGGPALSSLIPIGNRSGWVELPSWWGNHLRDNPWTGIGVDAPSGGLTKWRGTGQDGMSGALRFSGTR